MLALEQIGVAQNELESRMIGGFIEGRGADLSEWAFSYATLALLNSKDPHALDSFRTAFLNLLISHDTYKRLRRLDSPT